MEEAISFRTIVKGGGIIFGLALIILYLIFQARFLIIGPNIILANVPAPLQNERQIFLSGSAYNISRLWLNDRPIYTDEKGNFKEALVLENGYTISTLRAEDRYGRTTEVTKEFVYNPASFIQ